MVVAVETDVVVDVNQPSTTLSDTDRTKVDLQSNEIPMFSALLHV